MTEKTKRKLNATETIISSLPMIIEAFVIFYGESERERITNKFTNMLTIGYSKEEDKLWIINKNNKEKSDEIKDKFLHKLSENPEEREKLENLFIGSSDFEYSNMHPINIYINYINGKNQSNYIKLKVVEFLKQINPTTTIDNLDELLAKGTFRQIDTIIPVYKEALKEYETYKQEIAPYYKEILICRELKTELERKYTKKLISELRDLFQEEEYQEIQELFKSGYYSSVHSANGKTKNYTGYSLNGSILIEAFSKENDEKLISGTSWQKDSIKTDRIKYFKNFGLDLGDDYESYLNNPEAQKLTPSKELVERIKNTQQKIYKQMLNAYYTNIPEYKKNRARIEALGLLDKEDLYDENTYEQCATFISTNLRLIDGQYIENPILLLYTGVMEEYLDHNLVHELNHVLELSLPNIQDNRYKGTCGWDIVEGSIGNQQQEVTSTNKEREKRKYELFNEIINELITQEIADIMSQTGCFIFNTKENKKIKGSTSYEQTFYLVKTFYEKYKKEIIESRKNGDMTVLFDVIGKENFEALNELFNEHHKHFSGFQIYQLYEDLQKGIETEKTQKYKELVTRREQILLKMEEYSQKRKINM